LHDYYLRDCFTQIRELLPDATGWLEDPSPDITDTSLLCPFDVSCSLPCNITSPVALNYFQIDLGKELMVQTHQSANQASNWQSKQWYLA
jgi:hypothetical protein